MPIPTSSMGFVGLPGWPWVCAEEGLGLGLWVLPTLGGLGQAAFLPNWQGQRSIVTTWVLASQSLFRKGHRAGEDIPE